MRTFLPWSFVVLLTLASCSEKPPAAPVTIGQEGHGGDIAVTRVRTAMYQFLADEEQDLVQRGFNPRDSEHYTLLAQKMRSTSQSISSYFKWSRDERGDHVLSIDRERVRKATDNELFAAVTRFISGRAPEERKLIVFDDLHLFPPRLPLGGTHEFNPAALGQAMLHLASGGVQCKLRQPARGWWNRKLSDAATEVDGVIRRLPALVAQVKVEMATEPLFDQHTGYQVDAITQYVGGGHWRILIDAARLVGWWQQPLTVFRFVSHEYSHTFGLSSIDSDYLFAMALSRCY